MKIKQGNKSAVIRYSEDWEEYCVRFYLNGKRLVGADYFTDDRDDAIGTANAELARDWGKGYSEAMPL